MPEKAGEWKTRKLRFANKPNEIYTLRHRDPIEAIKTLWKDPHLSPTMKFKPKKVYTSSDKDTRIFNEMCTGQWWNILQVGFFCL